MKVIRRQPLRVLDFDTECRPMHYSEYRAESQITAVAWSWVGEAKVECELLEQDLSNETAMLDRFLHQVAWADVLTGHYLRKHDLPLLVDTCVRLGFSLPDPVLVQDTMLDLVRVRGLGKSQQNLAETFDLAAEKHSMSGAAWRRANTLTPAGQAATKKRVVSDVVQHKQLRIKLLQRGLLKSPKLWRP